jgi:hypothetical protein
MAVIGAGGSTQPRRSRLRGVCVSLYSQSMYISCRCFAIYGMHCCAIMTTAIQQGLNKVSAVQAAVVEFACCAHCLAKAIARATGMGESWAYSISSSISTSCVSLRRGSARECHDSLHTVFTLLLHCCTTFAPLLLHCTHTIVTVSTRAEGCIESTEIHIFKKYASTHTHTQSQKNIHTHLYT